MRNAHDKPGAANQEGITAEGAQDELLVKKLNIISYAARGQTDFLVYGSA